MYAAAAVVVVVVYVVYIHRESLYRDRFIRKTSERTPALDSSESPELGFSPQVTVNVSRNLPR